MVYVPVFCNRSLFRWQYSTIPFDLSCVTIGATIFWICSGVVSGIPETTPEHIQKIVAPIVTQLKSNGIVEYCQRNNERLQNTGT